MSLRSPHHAPYIPERGDLIWINFDPQSGSEQAGKRPAIVLSRSAYNRIGLCILCPITSKIKGFPFEVVLPEGAVLHGAVLCDQVSSLDWRSRFASFAGKLDAKTLEQITIFSAGIVQGK
jgi:mRNA interferase MazF